MYYDFCLAILWKFTLPSGEILAPNLSIPTASLFLPSSFLQKFWRSAWKMFGQDRARKASTQTSTSSGEWKAWMVLHRARSDGRITQRDRLQLFAIVPGRQPTVIGSNHPGTPDGSRMPLP